VKIFDLFGITVASSAGLCGAALAFSPGAAAAPQPTGGPTCIEQMAGLGAPVAAPPVPAVLPGPPVVAGAPPGAVPAGAPVPDGVPVPAGLPYGAPVPAGVPAGAPVAAGAPATALVAPAAPLLQQAGTGKGVAN